MLNYTFCCINKMKTNLLFGIIANSKTRVRCVFCGVYIPKANKCIDQHVNGSKHKENIDLMSENGISFHNDADILYCKPCDSYLPELESVTKHIETDSHANWGAAMQDLVEGEFIRLNDYLSSKSDNAFCEVCQSEIPCLLPNIEEHVNTLSHRGNIAEKLKPLNGIFNCENDDEVWCKVCDGYLTNTVSFILDHIDEDSQHMEWFMEIEDLIEDQDITLEKYLSNEFEKSAYCKKCNVDVICNVQSLEEHIHSEAHINQLSLIELL